LIRTLTGANWLPILASIPLIACGSSSAPNEPANVLDVSVAIPKADPAFLDFVSSEGIVPPGEERMFCMHVRYDGPDMAFDLLDSLQGKFGHHVVLLGVKEALPPGTMVDCTKKEEMSKYDAYTIGGSELPAGHGVFLPSGKPMAMQLHYVNTSARPIKIRDVVRLRKKPISEVKTWASIYVMNSLELSVPPHGKSTISVDCTVPADVKLLLVGGHMHEKGTSVSLQYGVDEKGLKPVYTTNDWKPEYRDNPPMTLFFENPMPLAKGALMRTTCSWSNDTDHKIVFPEEMCDSFGYIAGSKEPVVCSK
jgi:hypothetical protein